MNVDMTTTIPVGAKPGAATQTSKTAVDYQSFLKLLIAEMKNQDPTKPMDSTQYVAQLATFSQVEQSVQINTKLDQILQSLGAVAGRRADRPHHHLGRRQDHRHGGRGAAWPATALIAVLAGRHARSPSALASSIKPR